MNTVITAINRVLAESSGYLLIIAMLLTTLDVILRNCGFPIFGVVELCVYIVVAVVYFGLGHCEAEEGHVRMTVLTEKLSLPNQALLDLFTTSLSLLVMALATYACAISAWGSYTSNEAVMANDVALDTWPARAFIAVGMLGYVAQLCVCFRRHLGIVMKRGAL